MNILIPMAGLGSRFQKYGYTTPKPLIPIIDRPMIDYSVQSLGLNKGQHIFITRKYSDGFDNDLNNRLRDLVKDPHILTIDYVTEGAAQTCLLAKDLINNEEPLIITNCDQFLDFNVSKWIDDCIDKNLDGSVVTYLSQNPANSFIKVDSKGHGTLLKEKEVISNHALIGLHYWKKGKDFVRSAEAMIQDNIRAKNEFYVAPTYNYLIKEGLKIGQYSIPENGYWGLGTVEDVYKFIMRRESK